MLKTDFIDLKGDVFFKEDKKYEEVRLCWNRAINKRPIAIVYCENVDDIRLCFNVIKKYNIGFRIRSGAHHYEGFSTGDNILVIDVSRINKIDIDLNQNTIKIQAGTRNREVYEAVGKYDIPFPGGGCPTVGAIAYTLGGGWGYSARYLGLGIDSLLEVEILNFEGQIIKANKKENSDLFWALKGAGSGNFGVVTSMTFNLPKKEKYGTLVISEINNISIEEMVHIFKAWDENIETLNSKLNMKVAFYNDNIKGLGVKITGIFYGEKEDALDELKKITLNYKWNYTLKEMTILDINRWIQDNHPEYEKYKSTGRFVYKKYEIYEIRKILNILNEKLDKTIYTAISLYGMGGKIREDLIDENSFAYRNAKGILGFQALWEEDIDADINKRWVVEKAKIIRDLTTGSFVNFPLAELENYMEEYFEQNSEKLKKIKEKYDPSNFFKFEQGIN